MDYLREASASYPDGTGMSATLAYHPRFILWNAVAAVREENSQCAHSLLQPLIDTGDQYALQIGAWAYEIEGNYVNAIQVQKQLGNYKELLRMCRTAQENGDFDIAFAACDAAWQINMRLAALPLAHLLIETDRLSDGEKILRDALELFEDDPYRPYWLFRLAVALERQSRWLEAVEIHLQGDLEQQRRGVEVKSLPYVYIDLAWAYHMAGQSADAIIYAVKATAEPPQNADMFYVWFRAAQIYEAADLLPQALAAYLYCLELRPGHTAARDSSERLIAATQEN